MVRCGLAAAASALLLADLGGASDILAAARMLETFRTEALQAAKLGFPFVSIPLELLQMVADTEVENMASHQSPPTIPKQWYGSLFCEGSIMGIDFKDGHGTWYYDGPGQRYRTNYTARENYFDPALPQYRDMVIANVSGSMGQNLSFGPGIDDGCMRFASSQMNYSDPFAWMKYSKASGQKVIQGKTCTVYKFDLMKPMEVHAEACVTDDKIPIELNQTFGGPGSKFNGGNYYQFFDVVVGDLPEAAFAPSAACDKGWPHQPCEDKGVQTLDTYRIWAPPEPQVLDNRDTGDVMGDLSFVCTQGSGPMYRTKLITHWRVTVSTKFVQYALCNFNGTDNVCIGAPSTLHGVGRRSGQLCGRGPAMGQCSSNDDVGSQFSFPREAQCPAGVQPSAGGCAWGGAEPVKTIHASCLMEDRGLLKTCLQDIGKAPFKEAMKVWEQAFQSDDPSQGGCPPVSLTPAATAGAEIVEVIV